MLQVHHAPIFSNERMKELIIKSYPHPDSTRGSNIPTYKFENRHFVANHWEIPFEEPIHLYVTNGARLRTGDWAFWTTYPEKGRRVTKVPNGEVFSDTWPIKDVYHGMRKIIASTDASLGVKILNKDFMKKFAYKPMTLITHKQLVHFTK
jgi:hypothetical protein